MCFEPCDDAGALVGAVVVADQVDLEVVGDVGVDLDQELLELDRPVPAVDAGDDGAIGGVERREQAGRTVADIVMGAFSGIPGIIGNAGCDRARACTCDFSCTR